MQISRPTQTANLWVMLRSTLPGSPTPSNSILRSPVQNHKSASNPLLADSFWLATRGPFFYRSPPLSRRGTLLARNCARSSFLVCTRVPASSATDAADQLCRESTCVSDTIAPRTSETPGVLSARVVAGRMFGRAACVRLALVATRPRADPPRALAHGCAGS